MGTSTTERAALAKKIGPVPKAVEKQLWDIAGDPDPEAPVITNRKGEPEPDSDLRDNENVPLPPTPVNWEADPAERLASCRIPDCDPRDYVKAEVLPYVPDAWIDFDKTKIGYEIPLTRYFYKYVPPRPLAEIDAEIQGAGG